MQQQTQSEVQPYLLPSHSPAIHHLCNQHHFGSWMDHPIQGTPVAWRPCCRGQIQGSASAFLACCVIQQGGFTSPSAKKTQETCPGLVVHLSQYDWQHVSRVTGIFFYFLGLCCKLEMLPEIKPCNLLPAKCELYYWALAPPTTNTWSCNLIRTFPGVSSTEHMEINLE